MKHPGPPILAVGAHLKNAVAISTGDSVFVSQHIGDLETAPALGAFERVIADLQRLYEIRPEAVAMDAHPDYLSTKFALRFSETAGCPAVPVQHHFAHVLSCMAENEIDPPALGVAWDGTGYGLDGAIWGGEFFKIGSTPGLNRFAHFRTFSLPGGEAAVREPRRSALGLLYEIYGEAAFELDLPPIRAFSASELSALRTMLRRNLNTPRTSSAGRLFDAVASLAGLRHKTSFEGQTAMQLEFAATATKAIKAATATEAYPFTLSLPLVDWEPTIRAIVDDARAGLDAGLIAAKFHRTLADLILAAACAARETHIILTGGCFQNEHLLSLAVQRLRDAGMKPIWHQRIPPNDGGIALGQVAALWKSQPKPING
jgi:hydrogenase maturation protein HypF